jgi:hypothetical protein
MRPEDPARGSIVQECRWPGPSGSDESGPEPQNHSHEEPHGAYANMSCYYSYLNTFVPK